MPISWDSLGTTVGINVGVAVGVFFIFNYLRRVPVVADYYSAKRKLSLPFRFRPPRLPPTLFTWMVPVFTISDEQFAACAGYDALTYVNFLKLCLRLTFWITVLMAVMVLPTNLAAGSFIEKQLGLQDSVLKALKRDNPNATLDVCDTTTSGSDVDEALVTEDEEPLPDACKQLGDQLVVTTFDKTSMSNIDADESEARFLWVHVAALWLVTLLMMKLLWVHWQEALKWRIVYLAQTRKDDAAHAVLVRDIPGTPQGTYIGRIYDNIDGTIGMILPQSFKDKIKRAMTEGVGKVFGAVTDNKLVDVMKDKIGADKVKGALAGRNDLFNDRNLNVYRRPGDRAAAAAAAAAPYWQSARDADDFGDPEAAYYDAASMNGSFMSAADVSVYATPRNSTREASMPLPGIGKDDDFEEPYPQDEKSMTRPPIAGRRNLRNWRFEKPRTDFQTWEQAENALQNGVSVKELVRREFASDFGSQSVRAVTVLKNEINLSTRKKNYEKEKLKLEDLTDKWISMLRRKKPITRKEVTVKPNKKDPAHTKKWGQEKTKVDEMEYRLWLVQDCFEKLKQEQEIAKGEETSAAFVTMSSRLDQTAVASGMLSYREDLWVVDKAPEPTEVIWRNVAFRGWERSLRSLLSWGIFSCMVVFMLPIIAFITQIVNIEVYAQKEGASGAWARWILNIPFVSQVLPGILPTLGLKIFLALVPIVLTMSAVLVAALPSESAVDFDVGRKFYLFQFVVVFLFITVISAMSSGGGDDSSDLPVVALANQLIDDPGQIPTWLGTSIPQVVPTYLQYILVNGVLAKGIAFLRLPGAAIFYILSKLSGTKRQKKRLWSQQYMQYGPELADHTITMLLVCVFCLMQPFIPLVALIYFVCNYFYARYDLLYSKREAFQSGGLFWPVIFDQIYFGMMVMLVGYFALFGIKKFAIGTALTIPLIILMVLYRASVHSTFKRPMEVLSLHAAADLDRADKKPSWQTTITPEEEQAMQDAEWDLEEVKFGPVEERYMQPSLIVDEYAHTKTLDEARDVSQRVDSFNSGGDATGAAFILEDDMSDVSDHTDLGSRMSVRGNQAGPMLMAGHVPLSKKQQNA